jgi:hypothetical protein
VNSENAPIPSWLTDGGGIGSVKPGATGTTTQELPAGKWFLIPGTDNEEKAPKPQTPELEVTGGESGGALPKTDAKDLGLRVRLQLLRSEGRRQHPGVRQQRHAAAPRDRRAGAAGQDVRQAKTFLSTEKGQPAVDFEKAARRP